MVLWNDTMLYEMREKTPMWDIFETYVGVFLF